MSDWEDALMADPAPILGTREAASTFRAVWGSGVCPETARVPACCAAHDGAHVHGCVLPRRSDGREHAGGCLRRPDTAGLS